MFLLMIKFTASLDMPYNTHFWISVYAGVQKKDTWSERDRKKQTGGAND